MSDLQFKLRSSGTRSLKGRLLAHLLTTALLGVALMSVGAVSGLAADATIEAVSNTAWSPSTASIGSGGSVEFKNTTGIPHGIRFQSPPATPSCSGVPIETSSSSWNGTCTFAQAGEYNFVCTVHPGMTGKITVSGPSKPVVNTESATAIMDTEATLNGNVNPSGQATTFRFKYGTTTGYGQLTTEESAGEGSTAASKSATITGLLPATTYHFKIVATNGTGTSEGSDGTFTTSGPPVATTSPAAEIGGTEAKLAGNVNPQGHQTTYYFKYGATETYGLESAEKTLAPGSSSVSVSAALTGLTPETTYHFQLVAESSSGESKGVDRTFTTHGPPQATTGQATGVSDTAATLEGAVNAQGQGTTYYFAYGTTEAYGQKTGESAAGKGTASVPVSALLAGLTPETTYHFQLVAKSGAGTTSGADHTFTTAGAPPPPPPPLPPPPPAPETGGGAPDTMITLKPRAKTTDRTPTVKFRATIPGASYLCSVDRKAFKACRSPFTAPSLKPGRHRIRIKAVVNGTADPTPASCNFKVLPKTGRKKRHRKRHR